MHKLKLPSFNNKQQTARPRRLDELSHGRTAADDDEDALVFLRQRLSGRLHTPRRLQRVLRHRHANLALVDAHLSANTHTSRDIHADEL